MYVGRKGVGDAVSVPFSTWGLVGTPCSSSNAGNDGSSSSLLDNPLAFGLGALALGGVLLYAVFGGNR